MPVDVYGHVLSVTVPGAGSDKTPLTITVTNNATDPKKKTRGRQHMLMNRKWNNQEL